MCFNMKEARIQVANARKNFADVLARAAKKGERIKVVRYRTTLAGIVPGRDLERLDECDDLMSNGKGKRRTAAKGAKRTRGRTRSKVSAQASPRRTRASSPRATSRPAKKRAKKATPARK